MAEFGERSERELETLDPDLARVLRAAILVPTVDFAVIEGHRSLEEQARLYAQGRTTPGRIVTNAKPGESNHNTLPSPAVDIAPYVPGKGIDWSNPERFAYIAGVIMAIADAMGVHLRWGANWDEDREILTDQGLDDRPHFEKVA